MTVVGSPSWSRDIHLHQLEDFCLCECPIIDSPLSSLMCYMLLKSHVTEIHTVLENVKCELRLYLWFICHFCLDRESTEIDVKASTDSSILLHSLYSIKLFTKASLPTHQGKQRAILAHWFIGRSWCCSSTIALQFENSLCIKVWDHVPTLYFFINIFCNCTESHATFISAVNEHWKCSLSLSYLSPTQSLLEWIKLKIFIWSMIMHSVFCKQLFHTKIFLKYYFYFLIFYSVLHGLL